MHFELGFIVVFVIAVLIVAVGFMALAMRCIIHSVDSPEEQAASDSMRAEFEARESKWSALK